MQWGSGQAVSRRALGAAVVATLFVGGPPGARAASAAPAQVRPAASVVSLQDNGKRLTVGLRISFVVPGSTPLSAACDGKVSVAVALSARPRRTAARAAALSADGAACAATLSLPGLPSARKGKRISLRLGFKGNDAVRAFAVKRSVLLAVQAPQSASPPPAPTSTSPGTAPPTVVPTPEPTPAPTTAPSPTPTPPAGQPSVPFATRGLWGTNTPTTGPNTIFAFRVNADGGIPAVEATGSSFKWWCGGGDNPTLSFAQFRFLTPLSVATTNITDGTYQYVKGKTDVTASVKLVFDVAGAPSTGPITGSGLIHVAGVWDYGEGFGGVQSCTADFAFTTYWTGQP